MIDLRESLELIIPKEADPQDNRKFGALHGRHSLPHITRS